MQVWPDGAKYEGNWEKNNMEAKKATYTHRDGSKYIGK